MGTHANANAKGNAEGGLSPGDIVDGRYRIVEVAGRGGMGIVYKAEHVHFSRTVALKMLLSDKKAGPQGRARFKQEADAANQLRHPNIVTVYDFGLVGENQFYMAMDFLDGKSLSQLIKQGQPLSLKRFSHIFSQACNALAHAHKRHVVHRDIKSANLVLIEHEGDPDFLVIVDFGLVKVMSPNQNQQLTTTGMLVGSPPYMSPEQCRGQELDHRSDIYSLGCVMYETLTGKLPLLGETVMDTLYRHLNELPLPMREANPGIYVPPALERAVLKALAKEPARRQQSMSELGKEIDKALSGAPDSKPLISKQTTDLLSNQAPASPAEPPKSVPPAKTPVKQEAELMLPPAPAKKNQGKYWYLPVLAVWVLIAIATMALYNADRHGLFPQPTTRKIRFEFISSKSSGRARSNSTAGATSSSEGNRLADSASASAQPDDAAANPQANDDDNSPRGEENKLTREAGEAENAGNEAFSDSNWNDARASFEQALSQRDDAGTSRDGTAAVLLGKLAVCGDRADDNDAAARYMQRFHSVYDEHPDETNQDIPLLVQLSDLNVKLGDRAFAEQLLRTAVTTQSRHSSPANAATITLSCKLAQMLMDNNKLSEAEDILRQANSDSNSQPQLNTTVKALLGNVLRMQGKGSEADALANNSPS